MSYKSITWTIKNPDIITMLEPECRYNGHPQGLIRQCLYDAGLVSEKATQMMPQVNFPEVELGKPIRISFYEKDCQMLRDKAAECGLKVQQLIEQVMLSMS